MNKIKEIYNLLVNSYSNYKYGIALLIFSGFFSGLLEGVGVTSLIPLFSLITGKGELGDDVVSRVVQVFFSVLGIEYSLKFLLIFVFLLFLLKFLVEILTVYFSSLINTNYERDIMRKLFQRTVDASWTFLSRQKIGHLDNIFSIDVKYSRALLLKLSDIFMLLSTILVYVVLAVNISFFITSLTVFFGILLLLLYKPSVYKIKRDSNESNIFRKKVANFVGEHIMGIKVVKASGLEDTIKNKINVFFERLRKLQMGVMLRKTVSGIAIQPLGLLYIFIIFSVSYKNSDFNIASFTVIVFLIHRIFQYVKQLQLSMNTVGESIPYVKHIDAYLKETEINEEINIGVEPFKFEKQLEFEQVDFSYEPDKPVLDDFNIKINKGDMIGLVGSSGSGKTTVVDLLLRLYTVKKGAIVLDGRDITGIDLKKWRQNVGYVSQDLFLLNSTIAENIRFYDENRITEEDMIKAVKMANIYEFVKSKSQGLDYQVGERGGNLSVGQRQRIVIARVLARNPKILVFDEATSSLDSESEQVIKDVISSLKRSITIIIIAHRLNTVMDCDKVFVIQESKIIESGSPDKLLKNESSYFRKLYNIN